MKEEIEILIESLDTEKEKVEWINLSSKHQEQAQVKVLKLYLQMSLQLSWRDLTKK